jgi:hypothetical protein
VDKLGRLRPKDPGHWAERKRIQRAGTRSPMREIGPTFEQAESPVADERFLQVPEAKSQKQKHKLKRVAFEVSRLMEF